MWSVKQLNMKEKQKGGFLGMLLGILAASVIENMFAGKAKTPA